MFTNRPIILSSYKKCLYVEFHDNFTTKWSAFLEKWIKIFSYKPNQCEKFV